MCPFIENEHLCNNRSRLTPHSRISIVFHSGDIGQEPNEIMLPKSEQKIKNSVNFRVFRGKKP
jgi:hypothetical protein